MPHGYSRATSQTTSLKDWQSNNNKFSDAVVISSLHTGSHGKNSVVEGHLPPILIDKNAEIDEDNQQRWMGEDLENSSLINQPDRGGPKSALDLLERVASRVAQSVLDKYVKYNLSSAIQTS